MLKILYCIPYLVYKYNNNKGENRDERKLYDIKKDVPSNNNKSILCG